jgi:putative glutamine amidotransferase
VSSLPSDRNRPIVLVPACNRLLGAYHYVNHVVAKKYTDFIRLGGCLPLAVPVAQLEDIDQLLDVADGLLLTGSPSNVHPSHFGENVYDDSLPLDTDRDNWVLPLVPRALERGIPLFAICRGAQEANVALGGSLHQAVQEVPGKRDHRSSDELPPSQQYAVKHTVRVQDGGVLSRVLGQVLGDGQEFEVNSVHGQGVNRLASRLRVEALAPDGLVEAFSAHDAPGFSLCVQWHPEWQAADNPVSMSLLSAYASACQDYRDRHRPPSR